MYIIPQNVTTYLVVLKRCSKGAGRKLKLELELELGRGERSGLSRHHKG